MKYTIEGFNQKAAVDLGLTTDDLVFLRWFIDFKECGKMERKFLGEEINNMGYWVSYKKILEDLPILFTGSEAASKKKIQRMLNGNLSKLLIKDALRTKEQKGTKIFLGINADNYSLLIEKTTGQKCPVIEEPQDKNVQWSPDKNVQSDKSIKNKSIIYIDTNTEYVKLTQKQYDTLIEKYGEQAIKHYINKVELYAPNRKTPYKDYKAAILTFISNDIEKGIFKPAAKPKPSNAPAKEIINDDYLKVLEGEF